MPCGNEADDARTGTDAESPAQDIMPRKPKLDKALCVRCRVTKSSVVVGTASFCESIGAAIAAATEASTTVAAPIARPSKGRIGKNPNVSKLSIKRPDLQHGHALVGLSGGPGGLAMLDILAKNSYFGVQDVKGDTRGQLRPVWHKTWVCHVDFSDVVAGTIDQTERLKQMTDVYALHFVAVKAQDAFDPELPNRLAESQSFECSVVTEGLSGLRVNLKSEGLDVSPSIPSSSKTPLESLSHLLAALPPTSRPALLNNVLDSLMTTVAQVLPSISHILLGETSSRQAQNIITSTASGSGWTLPLSLSLWSPVPAAADIIRVKPMKQVLLNEAAYWCHLKGISTFSARNWHAVKAADGSVIAAGGDARGKSMSATLEGLTERFIAGLGRSHPSTVSTISRTGEKLMFRGSRDLDQSSRGLCPLCQLPAEPSSLDWKSRTALTSFPHKQPALSMDDVAESLPSELVQLAPLLCYGCLTALTAPLSSAQSRRQLDDGVDLPSWIQHRVVERLSRVDMRSQIADFLIEDD